MRELAATLFAAALAVVLTPPFLLPKADGAWIIRKVSGFVPALPTTNLVVNLAADGDVYNTGTTQATDGQAVETWVDAAGTAQNVTASGTDQPTWHAGGGTPYVEFDGNDILRYSSGAPTTGDDVTIYVVCEVDSIAVVQTACSITDRATALHYIATGNTTNPANGTAFFQVRGTSTAVTARSSAQLTNATATIIHGNNNTADTSRSVYIENAGSGVETTTNNYDAAQPDDYSVGASYSNGSEAANWDGKIYHVLIYDEEHDASERSDTIAYLQDKWGL